MIQLSRVFLVSSVNESNPLDKTQILQKVDTNSHNPSFKQEYLYIM
jgi:hypothetical protein